VNILKVSSDGTSEFSTISEAISKAPSNSRILVSEGVYNEAIVIEKPLEIIADGEPDKVTINSFGKPAVLIKTNSALVRGFTVRGYDDNAPFDPLDFTRDWTFYGIHIQTGDAIVENCRVWTDSKFSLVISGENANPTIRGCHIEGQSKAVCFVDKARGILENSEIFNAADTLVRITIKADPLIRRCLIYNGDAGVESQAEARGLVENCEIFDTKYFGVCLGKSYTTIRECIVHNSDRGITYDKTNIVENCKVYNIKNYEPLRDIRPDNYNDS
jgi:F-box protein 11